MPDDGPTVPAEILRSWLGELFARAGMPAEDAAIEADCLIAAHFRGFDTHGVPCVPPYVECLRARRINPRPAIRIQRQSPWTIAVDGDNGMGHVVATRAMRAAIQSADEIGIGVASVRHSNHIGAACIYPIMASGSGLHRPRHGQRVAERGPVGKSRAVPGDEPDRRRGPGGAAPAVRLRHGHQRRRQAQDPRRSGSRPADSRRMGDRRRRPARDDGARRHGRRGAAVRRRQGLGAGDADRRFSRAC